MDGPGPVRRVGELGTDAAEVAEDAQDALIASGPEVLDEPMPMARRG